MAKVRGKADGKIVAELIKSKLKNLIGWRFTLGRTSEEKAFVGYIDDEPDRLWV